MKGFSMNKVLGTIKKRPTFGGSGDLPPPDPTTETPEAIATRCVKQFCESGGSQTGDDITFLPYIVDAAESSPAAAAECARLIRKFLYRDYWTKPSYQYSAIMLIRILSDNPGPTFTRNLDKKFSDTAKELLRSGRDGSVRQLLMETLDAFENTKAHDEGLRTIIEMWKKEKEKAYKAYGGVPEAVPRALSAPAFNHPQAQQEYFNRSHMNRKMPNPVELANRLEEARTSAKLLEQVVACTPPADVLDNDLIKEFSDRCLSASRSIQGYMSSEPAPDNDTMESLIDTNEQLQRSLNQHQRAVLQAKKHLGINSSSAVSPISEPSPGPDRGGPGQPTASGAAGGFWQGSSGANPLSMNPAAPPPVPSRKAVGNGKGKAPSTWESSHAVGSSSKAATPQNDDEADPFRDPVPERKSNELPSLPYEPFHPGFGSSSGQDKSSGLGSGSRSGSGAQGKTNAGSSKNDPITPVSDDELYERDDAYKATPPSKSAQTYRH